MNIPTREECFKLIRQMDMMDHIIDHSIMVSNVALCLCRHLEENFPHIHIDRVICAALLHDITKTRSFSTGEVHSATGGLLLKSMGYPEIGDIIRQHVILDICPGGPKISEQEIVNYADKRVLHDQVVSLERRLEYIQVRYGTKPEFMTRIQTMWENTLDLEEKIFKHLPFKPSQLSDKVPSAIKKQ
ncbi:MAG: HD domain-containing protein [Proteobacteria bacterium]|nr:HD domain-containing protein [Desulfobacula sp.]MBU3951441.1 HD domain-containing protein [Pseudomonadota bacterium]MBU4133561.1 HD domain-containing protein [Pseudomonadota bacterium]